MLYYSFISHWPPPLLLTSLHFRESYKHPPHRAASGTLSFFLLLLLPFCTSLLLRPTWEIASPWPLNQSINQPSNQPTNPSTAPCCHPTETNTVFVEPTSSVATCDNQVQELCCQGHAVPGFTVESLVEGLHEAFIVPQLHRQGSSGSGNSAC